MGGRVAGVGPAGGAEQGRQGVWEDALTHGCEGDTGGGATFLLLGETA